jgi:hypothetical protein
VDEATAQGIAKAQLDAGEVEDDLHVDDATLDRHMDAVAKAMGAPPADPAIDPDDDPAAGADPLNKADGTAVDPDDDPAADPDADPADVFPFSELVDTVAKGAQDIVEDVTAKHEVLAKAYLDLGATSKAMMKGLDVVSTRLEAFEKTLGGIKEDLAKAMGQPVPPRAQDFEPVPHPGDGNGDGGSGITRDDVMNKAWAKLKETTDERDKHMLKSAIMNLEIPGCNHEAIAKSLGL